MCKTKKTQKQISRLRRELRTCEYWIEFLKHTFEIGVCAEEPQILAESMVARQFLKRKTAKLKKGIYELEGYDSSDSDTASELDLWSDFVSYNYYNISCCARRVTTRNVYAPPSNFFFEN